MKKSEQEGKTQGTGVPVPSGTDTTQEKPGKRKKPRAVRRQEKPEPVTEMAEEPGSETEEPEVSTESGITEETAGENGTGTEEEAEVTAQADADTQETEAAAEEEPGTDMKEPEINTEIVESPLKRMKQEFQQRAQVIREQMFNIQNSFITIGFQLHWIRENNMFRVLNYRNIYEYAEKECNIKRTTCGNLICIIENYADRDENGEVIESIADCYRNYSASQLVAMLGMPEEMKQQVTPDMSVRAINRLRKGEPDPSEAAGAGTVLKAEQVPAGETVMERTAEETAVPDDSARRDEDAEAERTMEQRADSPAGDYSGPTAAEDSAREDSGHPEDGSAVHEETKEVGETEDTGAAEPDAETVDYAAGEPEGNIHDDGDMLAEIDSYMDYQSMLDELDLIMKHVFSSGPSVRVKILCVHG